MDATTASIVLSSVAGFLLGGGVVGAAWWVLGRRLAQQQATALAEYRDEQRALAHRHSQEIRRQRRAHRSALRELESARLEALTTVRRERWFDVLRKVPWEKGAPEVEVEAKFVFQLLSYLGYEEEDMELRTSIPVQEGSKQTVIEADWVVRNVLGQALMVVEVKAPDSPLSDVVRDQARSYAFHLGAPVYAVTNGLELQIYHLGVIEDSLVLSCRTSELGQHWEAMERVASEASVTELRLELEQEGRGQGKS
jgi:hypothetical protein